MRSTPKPALMAAIMFLCVCCAQFAEAQRQTEGKTEGKLEPKPGVVSEFKEKISIPRDPTKCCPRKPRCCRIMRLIKALIALIKSKSISDLGILVIFPNDSTAVVEEVSLQIYSVNDELLFSTKTQNLSLRATDNPTGYLLTLDRTAASIAQRHFIEENKILVTFETSGGKGAPDMVYLVNVNEGKRAK